MRKNNITARERHINSPPVKDRIREYLLENSDGAKSADIINYVLRKVTLLGNTPRDSIRSTLYRMADVERIGPGKYRLIR